MAVTHLPIDADGAPDPDLNPDHHPDPVVLITGGAKRIGHAIALRLHRRSIRHLLGLSTISIGST